MAAIHDLLAQVQDEALKVRLEQEINRLSKAKKFGLVFEEHLPECTPLYDIPVKSGSMVAKKNGAVSDMYEVAFIKDDVATCYHKITQEKEEIPVNELVCVAQFGEPIYPYLKPIDSVCNAPDSNLWHTLIEADNYHALQLLEYLYAGKVDCIYIDPPYNTGAKDWKYNNDYVDGTDAYRHSKWLSMMEKRLKLAKKLLNPENSIMMITIDDIELCHLKILLESLFSECYIQIIDNGTEVNSSENEAIDREGVMKAINDSGLLTYDVRSVKISNYLNSLYALARLLVQSGKYEKAKDDVLEEIVKQIREYAMDLRRTGKYDEMAKQIMEFEMKTQIFDAFGQSVDDNIIYHFMSSTDTDIDRQFRKAESKLGNEGVANKYGRYFYDEDDPNAYKIDVILYAADDDCTEKLQAYAEKMFHELNDKYRRKMVNMEERFIKQYNTIVSDGDIVSKHNFRLPEIIQQPRDVNGKEYTDHLFVDDSGVARINLNSWEEGVLKEEQAQPDYVCWLRNPPRKAWSLCIPYEMRGEQKPTYPDFLIVRRDNDGEYVIDILEPHDPTRIDNLGKAKGFAEYARQNPGVGRIELIRKGKDGTGHERFKRLDMARSAIRDKVSHVMTNDELDHIFDTDGKFIN